MIKNFVDRIKATKKIANEKNVHNWYNCVLNSLILIMVSSFMLSLYTIILLADVTLDTTIGELLVGMDIGLILPVVFGITLSYLFLEKLIILHILIFEKLNKTIFKAWQRFDMWYYRKYRKTSPITENLAKIQGKLAKHQTTKRNKRIVLACVIGFFIILNITVRLPYIISVFDDTEITEIEINNEGEGLDRYGNPVSEERNYNNCLEFDDYPGCPEELIQIKVRGGG